MIEIELNVFLDDIDRRASEALHRFKIENGLVRYTIADACGRVGENPRTFYRIAKRGNTTIKSVIRLANVLQVEPKWLLSGDINSIDWRDDNDGEQNRADDLCS